ncbi:hypothetical protein J6590_059995 [Homalodisca vitripennis]|nr:hypothetical protein J6590_059995 [Homalodisca vitripennis]
MVKNKYSTRSVGQYLLCGECSNYLQEKKAKDSILCFQNQNSIQIPTRDGRDAFIRSKPIGAPAPHFLVTLNNFQLIAPLTGDASFKCLAKRDSLN